MLQIFFKKARFSWPWNLQNISLLVLSSWSSTPEFVFCFFFSLLGTFTSLFSSGVSLLGATYFFLASSVVSTPLVGLPFFLFPAFLKQFRLLSRSSQTFFYILYRKAITWKFMQTVLESSLLFQLLFQLFYSVKKHSAFYLRNGKMIFIGFLYQADQAQEMRRDICNHCINKVCALLLDFVSSTNGL